MVLRESDAGLPRYKVFVLDGGPRLPLEDNCVALPSQEGWLFNNQCGLQSISFSTKVHAAKY